MKIKHLEENNMTYRQHCGTALSLSGILCCGGFKTFLHAICPSIFTTSATDTVKRSQEILENR